MTSPLSPEAVAQMVADREAGTPGPWTAKPFDRTAGSHLIGYVIDRPDGWSQIAKVQTSISAMSDWYAPARHVDANASRIARLPDLEAAYLTLAAENATLRASEAAALERVKRLEADVQLWRTAFKTGRNEPLYIAYEASTPTADKE